jgi:hypothetical protein
MIHIVAPTMWVIKTVSSVRAIKRDMIEGDVLADLERTKRVRRRRVRTPSVKADKPIQRIATTCEGIDIGRS